MSWHLRWSLPLSASLHLLLWLHFNFVVAPVIAQIPLQIQLIEVPSVPSKLKSGGGHSHAGGHAGIQLGDLGPHLQINARALHGENLKDYGDTGVAEGEWGSHAGLFSEVEHYSQYVRLFNEIEGILNYPGRLGVYGIDGTVNTRLVFDSASHCDWTKSHIGGAHPYLGYYVLTLLKKLCVLENVEHMRFKGGQFADLSFAFVITDESGSHSAPDRIVSNVLAFTREYPKPKLEYHVGPFVGFFPFPAVTVDFEWVERNREKYMEGKNPLREFQGHGADAGL